MQYKDRVLVDTPIPLFFKGSPGLLVEAYIAHPDYPLEAQLVQCTTLETPADHLKIYACSTVPTRLGWYHVTFRASIPDGDTVASDATRFYAYSSTEEGSSTSIGEPVLQEVSVKVGERTSLAYRGVAGLQVSGLLVFQDDLAQPEARGLAVSFVGQPAPTGYRTIYLATVTPTREGKYYVYVKTTPAGGEALIVVNAFKTLPYSRAAGTIKSSATSTVT